METQTKTRPNAEIGTRLPMVHWLDPKRKGYALCGMKIKKYLGPITSAECVVCEQMKHGS